MTVKLAVHLGVFKLTSGKCLMATHANVEPLIIEGGVERKHTVILEHLGRRCRHFHLIQFDGIV